jgi:hypothetical protein
MDGVAPREQGAHQPADLVQRGWRAALGTLVREPLVRFLLIGTVLVLAVQGWRGGHDPYRIEVTPVRVAELARRYALQFGTTPDPATLARLVEDDIHDEILFREGRLQRLDDGDEIIRRRIIQKQQFLMQDLAAPAEPSEAQLRVYYGAHQDRYAAAPRVTFSHVYFRPAQTGSADTDLKSAARARAVLARLPASRGRAPDLGDPFPDLYDFAAFEPQQAKRLFGETPLADAIFAAPVGRWSGPFRSAYGWHLVHVTARTTAAPQEFGEVRDRVRDDYLRDALGQANSAAFERLARRFVVVRKDRVSPP